ncbi:hypothetical protein COX84_00120, partial [Candidatus Micrarchaeota archaeon CG_4_10_14_0_2_um_filter_49_7]
RSRMLIHALWLFAKSDLRSRQGCGDAIPSGGGAIGELHSKLNAPLVHQMLLLKHISATAVADSS